MSRGVTRIRSIARSAVAVRALLAAADMRSVIAALLFLSACMVGLVPDPGGDPTNPDPTNPNPDPNPDPTPSGTCPLPATEAMTATLTATEAQMCNVSGSAGAQHWYRLAATLPSGATDLVQLELWDGTGAFAGTTVHTGTFQISGVETDFTTCGVCVRAIGHKGGTDAKEYLGISGTVNVTAVGANGAPISATITNVELAELDANHAQVANGCTSVMAGSQVDGTVVQVGGGTAGGGGGGGGGGAAAAAAAAAAASARRASATCRDRLARSEAARA